MRLLPSAPDHGVVVPHLTEFPANHSDQFTIHSHETDGASISTPGRSRLVELIGRDPDVESVCGFVDEAAVRGGVLLVSGDAGVGKSVLLEVAACHAAAAGTWVIRAVGAEFEAEVSFSGLSHVLHPLRDRLSALPPLYREALSVALGLHAGAPANRLVLSNAVLALLHDAAATRPLLVVVDDLPYLDRASSLVLASAARRLSGTRVGFLAALRTEAESFFDRAALPSYELKPLDEVSAKSLLSRRFPALSRMVRERLVREAQGNPLALLELPIALRDAEPVRHHPADVLPLTARLQCVFASRIRNLPEPTADMLLNAVLDGTGDLRVLEAAAPVESGLEDLAPAEHAGLIQVDGSASRLTFRHPLIRSAVVALSTSDQRRRSHRVLAECVPVRERRAWHLAQATVGPDESVAALLEEVARAHLNRGDAVRAVAEMSRAAELSPATSDQGRRWAQAAYIGATVLGDLTNASLVLDDIREIDPDHSGSVAGALAAGYHLLNGDGDVDTAHRLLAGAIEMLPDTSDAANELLTEAIYNLLEVCFFGGRAELWPPFRRAIARLEPQPPTFLDLLSKTIPDPARDAIPALDVLEETIAGLARESNPTRIVRVAVASAYVERLPLCRDALWRVVRDGRAGGAITMSIQALGLLGFDAFLTGQWDSLVEIADEGVSLSDTHNYGLLRWPTRSLQALLAAARGDSITARAIADEVTGWAVPRRAEATHMYVLHARALDAIGRGDFENAYRHASAITPAGTIASHVPHAMWTVMDLVEAAARTGRDAEATAHFEAAREACLPGISSRLALITYGAGAIATTDNEGATALFEKALGVSGADQWPFDHARVQLAFGEHLRRCRATSRARRQLIDAHDAFQRLRARPWTQRSGNELRATGLTLNQTAESGAASLTPQQLEIAQLAAEGLTNKEIGERLFLSHRTVGTHLYQLFPKLGITSRAALRDALQRPAPRGDAREIELAGTLR
jgi:DNA-binding CsgD family transcriptional regulator/tetratricopeptide (TPR) repeat protein